MAKVETLLDRAKSLDLGKTDGPTGYAGERLFDGIRDFQKRNGLKVDGRLNPGGPTLAGLKNRFAPPAPQDTSRTMDLKPHERIERPGDRMPLPYYPDKDTSTPVPKLAAKGNDKNGTAGGKDTSAPSDKSKPNGDGDSNSSVTPSDSNGGKDRSGENKSKLPIGRVRIRMPGEKGTMIIDQQPPKTTGDDPAIMFDPKTG